MIWEGAEGKELHQVLSQLSLLGRFFFNAFTTVTGIESERPSRICICGWQRNREQNISVWTLVLIILPIHLARHSLNIGRLIFELSGAGLGKNLMNFQQTTVKRVFWKYFCTIRCAFIRVLQLMGGSLINLLY